MDGRRDTTAEAERVRHEFLRTLSGSQRSLMAAEMTEEMNAICRAGIAQRHPNYSTEQVEAAFVRLVLGDELYFAACPHATLFAP